MPQISTTELTLTISLRDETDFDTLGYLNHLFTSKAITGFIVAEHNETHLNRHIYHLLVNSTRIDNFKRQNVNKFYRGSIEHMAHALHAQATTLQSFVNYTKHEATCKYIPSTTAMKDSLKICEDNYVPIVTRDKTLCFTRYNAVRLILQFLNAHHLEFRSRDDRRIAIGCMLKAGYTFVPIRQAMHDICEEIFYLKYEVEPNSLIESCTFSWDTPEVIKRFQS